MPTIQPLSLDLIEVLESVQPRDLLNQDAVNDYAEIYALSDGECPLPPLHVFKHGDRRILSRGFHRIAGGIKAGRSSLPCELFDGNEQDAARHAVDDDEDSTSAVRRTRADRRRIVNMILDDPERVDWSLEQIAARAGVHLATVQRIMADRKKTPPQSDKCSNATKPTKGGATSEDETPTTVVRKRGPGRPRGSGVRGGVPAAAQRAEQAAAAEQPAPRRRRSGSAKVKDGVAELIDALTKKHIGPLARGINDIKNKIGETADYKVAYDSLNECIGALKKIRKAVR